MRVNTIQTVEFGSSRDSVRPWDDARGASFEQALSDAKRADNQRADQAGVDDSGDARDRRADDVGKQSDEPKAEKKKKKDDPDEKKRDEDDDGNAAARQLAIVPSLAADHAAAANASHAVDAKQHAGIATATVARSARTFATEPLGSTPQSGVGGDAPAAPAATAATHGATPAPAATVPSPQAPAAVDGAAPATDDGRTAATVDPTAETRGKPLTAKTTSARFIDPRTLQAIEAQRDSVFRQIAMRVTPEGGEMRVRLDPPELGEVDVQLVVEKGATMRMLVVTERPEMADMLERHIDELCQTLQQQGITVTDASIHARHDHDAQRGLFGDRSDESGRDRFEESDEREAIAAPSGGYISSEGLDFWV